MNGIQFHSIENTNSNRLGTVGFIGFLALCLLVVYWQGIWAYFSDNDMVEIKNTLDNAHRWYLHGEYWRPVYYLIYHLMYVTFGLNPLPYHLLSFVLYLCFLVLLYHFYVLFLKNDALSKMTVLLFASFYLHTEVVSRFVCLAELIWPLFGLAALVCFFHYRKSSYVWYYILAILFTFLASQSKEPAVTLPLLLLALDYYITYGETLPALSIINRFKWVGLLPHLPFCVIALAMAVVNLTVPAYPYFQGNVAHSMTIYRYVDNVFFLVAYVLAPCFLGTKLTLILSFTIFLGLVWLFYSSALQVRAILLVTAAMLAFSLIPYTLTGIAPRYVFMPSVFSMLLVALLVYGITGVVYRWLGDKFGLQVLSTTAKAVMGILILLPVLFVNYHFTKRYTSNCVKAGKIVKEIVESTKEMLPKGPDGSKIIHLNLPSKVQCEIPFSYVLVAFDNSHLLDLYMYYLYHGIVVDLHDFIPINVDLGYSKVIFSDAWCTFLDTTAPVVSVEEYNALAKNEKNVILFFNPIDNRLVDVSGKTYEQLAKDISSYKHKLN